MITQRKREGNRRRFGEFYKRNREHRLAYIRQRNETMSDHYILRNYYGADWYAHWTVECYGFGWA